MEIRESYRWRSKSVGDGGKRTSLSRRALLGSAFAAFLHAEEPELSSFDLSLIDDPVVPAELFFVREHFPPPVVSAAGWKMAITGLVARSAEVSLDEIAAAPRKVLPVTLECAENGVGGGLVSHAEWTGAPLRSLLERVEPKPEAAFVRLSGADGFSRSIPLAKAMHADTLIAYTMNSEKLPVKHGFPLRAVIPGWFGMDSVKWLREIEIRADESNRNEYVRLTRSLLTGTRPSGAVSTMNVKSAFARPVDGAILGGRRFTVRGAAWAGEHRVRQVEVSTDGGKTWLGADLNGRALPYAWTLWQFEWKIPGSGEYDLVVRAADEQGRVQPEERAADRADAYELNTYQRIRVRAV
jgi:DMSO/TMAO reductase YedYZ molybdopterin-dependent catalytic subunit